MKVIQRKTNLGWRSGYFQEKILLNGPDSFIAGSTKFIWIENLSCIPISLLLDLKI